MSSLATLAALAPATSDVLHWIGLQRRQSRLNSLAYGAAWFGAGVAVGSAAALLLTPQSGPEMRRRLRGQAERARDYVAAQTDGGERGAAATQQH
ncbi:MAG TPA: YtxH domain-containing protein [Myxococcota bacterium]|nr:YtxH domain-containing protein [Myxococcota bacterium]